MGGVTKGYISCNDLVHNCIIVYYPYTRNKLKFWMTNIPYTQGPVGERTGSSYDDRSKETNNV